jgi:hypothetical protein
MTRLAIGIQTALLAGVIASPATGQDYGIGWWTLDAGSGVLSGGSYTLSYTLGQHDAHPASQSGAYVLTGGFWPGVVDASPCNAADLAPPFGLLDLSDINAFVSAFVGQDLLADLTGNGLLDLSDINLFIASFASGCVQ